LGSAGQVTSSRSLGSYDVWTNRVYNYDTNGSVRSIRESYESSGYVNTRTISSTRSLSRSGRVQSVTYRVSEDSTVPSRSSGVSEIMKEYHYDDNDQLTKILQIDEYGNQEAKAVDQPGVQYSSSLSRAMNEVVDSEVTDAAASDFTKNPSSASGKIENSYLEISSNVHDFRPLGIRETFQRGIEVATPLTQLVVGSVFIDEGGVARKIIAIQNLGSRLIYHTISPEFSEFLNDVVIPTTSYDWKDMDDLIEYLPPSVQVTPPTRGFDMSWSTGITVKQDVDVSKGPLTLSAEVALELNTGVDFSFDFGMAFGKFKRWKWYNGYGTATIDSDVTIDVTGKLALKGELEHPFLLYPKGIDAGGVKFKFGLFFIPNLTGTIQIGAGFDYNMAQTMNVRWEMPFIPIPRNFKLTKYSPEPPTWGYSVKAEADANLDLKLLAIGGEAEIFGKTLVETYPGVGLYANVNGFASMGSRFQGKTPLSTTAEVGGGGSVGFFMEGSLDVWDGKFSWKMFDLRFPFKTWEAKGAQKTWGW